MATGNFNPDPVKQKKLNQKAREIWIDGPRGKKIMIVNSKGEFVRPNRLGTEQGGAGYKKWQGRINDAMLKSGLYPRLNRAAGVQDRHNQTQYKKTINDLKIINDQFSKIEASKESENEYSMSLAIPGLTKRKAKLEARRLELEEQSIGTNWDLFNDPTSPSYKDGGTEIKQGTTVGKTFVRTDGEVAQNMQIIENLNLSGNNTQQAVTNSTSGAAVSTDSDSTNPLDKPVQAKGNDQVAGSLKIWSRGGGRTLDQADAQTESWLRSRGVDVDQISKHNKRSVYRDLRARGPHIVNGTIRLDGGRGNQNKYNLKIKQP